MVMLMFPNEPPSLCVPQELTLLPWPPKQGDPVASSKASPVAVMLDPWLLMLLPAMRTRLPDPPFAAAPVRVELPASRLPFEIRVEVILLAFEERAWSSVIAEPSEFVELPFIL